ncbi:tyrosine-type recombinase/integrase [Paraburkholderia atlantica]|uniref:tyrosine-type recombinase/integrase n=1 Tax=Paraburkholderia atlantica TaxID=2654982 RepID=UPI003D1C1C19
MKISVKQLEALRAKDAGREVREVGGLVGRVRSTASGMAATFYFEFKKDGRKRRMPLGSWPRDSLADVRAARDAARALLDTGVDPLDARKADRLEAQVEVEARVEEAQAILSRPTFRDRFDEWERTALAKRKDKGSELKRAFVLDVFPVVGNMAMEDVKRSHIMSILDAITARGANRLANRTLTDMKQLMKWCMVREHITVDPTYGLAKRDVGGVEQDRDRFLSVEELRALPSALTSSGLLETTQHVMWTILGTNCRIGEVVKAKRADIDLQARTWRIPRENSKTGDAHMVFLSDFAAHHLGRLLDLSSSDTWLLPARKRDGSETHADPKGLTKQIGDRQVRFYERTAHSKRTQYENGLVLGEEKWTPHDLRRTAATLLQALKVAPAVIEACMNHREENRMKRVYQRHDYAEEKREAWHLLGERLELLLRPDADNVVILNTTSA